MPIYNPNYKNWQVCKSINLKKYFEIVGKFREVLYSTKNIPFEESIHLNGDINECYIGTFDYSKSQITIEQYQNLMEDLIYRANVELAKKRKFDNYKLDIYGSWINGKIIILDKK